MMIKYNNKGRRHRLYKDGVPLKRRSRSNLVNKLREKEYDEEAVKFLGDCFDLE